MKRFVLAVALLLASTVLLADAPRRSMLVATRHLGRLAVKSLGTTFDPSVAGRNYTEFNVVNGFAADLTENEIAELKKSSEVLFVEEDRERHTFRLGLEPEQRLDVNAVAQVTPYGIDLVRAPQAWVAGRGASVNVAVLDTGIDYNHPDLKPEYAGGYNTFTKTDNPMDDNGHGTHCSGTIAAANNDIGVVGVAPQAHLWGVKVLDKDGSGKSSNIIAGVGWVVQKKTDVGGNWVMSLSLGSCSPSALEQQAFDGAGAAGILIVAAAGNHDPSKPETCTSLLNNLYSVSYPAAYPGIIAVAAIDSCQTAADFSNFGPEVALAAPGVDVLSTFPVGTGAWSVVIPSASGTILAPPLRGSPAKDLTAQYVLCNLGKREDFPASVAGKIALIKRGDITFHDKAQNAKAAGAVGVVIFNKDCSAITWTLIGRVDQNGQVNPMVCNDPTNPGFSNCKDDPADLAYAWPLTVGISLADGEALVRQAAALLSVSYSINDYAIESGTSMACPHVAGAAATVWSIAPHATAAEIKEALLSTAHDLGDPGVDKYYGHGLVDAEAAGRQLNPAAFSPPQPPTGRQPGRRGH